MIDSSKLGPLTADLMTQLEKQYEEEQDAQLGDVVIVTEVRYTDEDGDPRVEVFSASTTDNRVHQSGILGWGKLLVDDSGIPASSGEDDG